MSDEIEELDETKVEEKVIEIGEEDAVDETVEVELADGVLSLDALAEEEEDNELDMDSYDDKDAF